MSLGIGSIVSVGGGSSGGGGGSGSGIQSINSQTGPAVVIVGVNGISVSAGGNTIVINGAGLSGLIGSSTGTISGVSINAVVSYSALFSNLSSGLFSHNFGTRETIVQVYDNSSPPQVIWPDAIISENLNQISVLFNTPQDGRVVIHAPSGAISVGSSGGSSSGVTKFAASFSSTTNALFVHGLNTLDVLVQVYDNSSPRRQLFPDEIIVVDANQVSVLFNTPQSGRVVIV